MLVFFWELSEFLVLKLERFVLTRDKIPKFEDIIICIFRFSLIESLLELADQTSSFGLETDIKFLDVLVKFLIHRYDQKLFLPDYSF